MHPARLDEALKAIEDVLNDADIEDADDAIDLALKMLNRLREDNDNYEEYDNA